MHGFDFQEEIQSRVCFIKGNKCIDSFLMRNVRLMLRCQSVAGACTVVFAMEIKVHIATNKREFGVDFDLRRCMST